MLAWNLSFKVHSWPWRRLWRKTISTIYLFWSTIPPPAREKIHLLVSLPTSSNQDKELHREAVRSERAESMNLLFGLLTAVNDLSSAGGAVWSWRGWEVLESPIKIGWFSSCWWRSASSRHKVAWGKPEGGDGFSSLNPDSIDHPMSDATANEQAKYIWKARTKLKVFQLALFTFRFIHLANLLCVRFPFHR